MKKIIFICSAVLLLCLSIGCAPQYEIIQTQDPAAADRLITPSASPKPSALPTTVPDTIPNVSPTPNASPNPNSLPTPSPSPTPKITENKPPEIGKFHPVVFLGYLLGGSDGGRWLSAERGEQDGQTEIGKSLNSNELYKLYTLDGYMGNGIGSEVFEIDSVETVDIEHTGKVVENMEFVAVSCDWDCMPRKHIVQANDNRIYIDIVKNVLAENGLDGAPVKILYNYRIDLEGDGVDEVVLYAKNTYNNGSEDITYSLLMLRKLVEGEIKNIVLEKVIYKYNEKLTREADNDPWYFYYFDTLRIGARGFLDLNGDGKLEIVVYISAHEWYNYSVYEVNGDVVDTVMSIGFGA